MKFLSKFHKNIKAAVTPATIILMAVSFLLVAILVPIGLNAIGTSTNWTGKWDSTVITIFTVVVPILFLIGLVLMFLPRIGKHD